ncbi:AraC family transcriptional regulator [Spirosoma arcticum]
MKALIVPQQLEPQPNNHRTLDLNGCSVVESCYHGDTMQGSIYVAEHELIYVLSGEIHVRTALGNVVKAVANEAVFLKRGSYADFAKLGRVVGADYESVLFFLKDTFVEEFISRYRPAIPCASDLPSIIHIPAHSLLDNFVRSLVPYFSSPLAANKELLRLKTFEFLLNLSAFDPQLLAYLFHLTQPQRTDLVQIMELHYAKNLPLSEFAYLTGRSLSTFKRDFNRTFGTSPHRWLFVKRLALGHYLLENTDKSVLDICLEAGFEDVSHFSKSFRRHYGYPPTGVRTGQLIAKSV